MPRGDFSTFDIDAMDKEMLASAFHAISSVEGGWEFLKEYSPPENEGFMFVRNPPETLKYISAAVSDGYPGHSGASYGWTMRHMEALAKRGWDKWATTWKSLPDKGTRLKKKLEELQTEKSHIEKELAQLATTDLLNKAVALDNFMATNPPTDNLIAFANAIQKDEGMRKQIPNIDDQTDTLRRFKEGKISYAEMRSLCG
jgi:hypothetical protein